MLLISCGEIMRAVELRARAEEEIVLTLRIEHGIHRIPSRSINRSRRKTGIAVGIVRRIYCQMFPVDSVQCVVVAECYGRISLQLHPLVEAVQIHSRNFRIFRNIIGFAPDNGGQDSHLGRSQSLDLGLGLVLLSPESIQGSLVLVQNRLHRVCPIDLIGVRDDEAEHVLRCESVACQQGRILQGGHHVGRVKQHLPADLPGQIPTFANRSGNDKIHRSLPSALQHSRHVSTCIGRGYSIMSRLNPGCLGRNRKESLLPERPLQTPRPNDDSAVDKFLNDVEGIHLRIYVYLHPFPEVRELPVHIFPADNEAGCRAKCQKDGKGRNDAVSC